MGKKKKIELPEKGVPYDQILAEMDELIAKDVDWKGGKAFGYVYHWTDEHEEFLAKAHNKFFSANALSPLAFPSLKKFETETISMAINLFHGDHRTCGNLTSGGTESILMAIKTYRDWAKKKYPHIKKPEMVLPVSAHPAFNKAAHYFDVTAVYVPLDENYHADIKAMEAAISENTILLVGSACDYPTGGMDPIEKIAALAKERNIGCHVDCCIGGYMLVFLQRMGYPIPPFDFEVPGVTSISADLHKYGHTAKGTSTLMFKNKKFWKNQFHAYTEWTGGVYASPTMNGTRPGAIMAAAWAGMRAMGMEGYKNAAKITKETADRLIEGINAIPELHVVGKPIMTLLSFTADDEDINMYAVADAMSERGWLMDKMMSPVSLHLIVNPHQAPVVDDFLKDMQECVKIVKANPELKASGEAAMYGMLATFDNRDKLEDVVIGFLADQYKSP